MTEQIKPTTIDGLQTNWQRWRIDLLLILVTAIWGGTFLVVQNSIKLIGPFSYISLRFGVGAIALALIFGRHLRRITRAEVWSGTLIGVFLALGYIFQTVGLQYTTSSKTGFITGLNVVIVPVLAVFVLRQWPGLNGLVGILMATVGLTLLSMGNDFNLEFGLGEGLVLGCAICFAWQIILISRLAPGKNAYNLAIVQIAVTSVVSGVAAPFFGERLEMPSAPVWWSVLFMGVVGTAFTFAVMNRVQQLVSSTRAALIYALEPAWAGLFGLLAGESLSLPAGLGCLLIFGGMISTEVKLKPRKQATEPTPETELVA